MNCVTRFYSKELFLVTLEKLSKYSQKKSVDSSESIDFTSDSCQAVKVRVTFVKRCAPFSFHLTCVRKR